MKKNTLFILIGLILLIVFSFWYFSKEEKPPINTIVALGDSLTAGYGATEGNDYVSLLEKKIGKDIINMGVSGDTSSGVLNRVAEVAKKNPDMVILFIGGNDVLRKVSSAEMFANIKTIISVLQMNGAEVVLVGIPGGILTDPLDTEFEELAERYDLLYVPEFMGSLIRGRKYMHDSIHPNDQGYEIVAEKIYDVIKGRVRE